jgi:hypothetical protein
MILMELDKTMQSFGQLPDYSTVPTIEHVIPQTLDPSWEAYLGEDVESLDFYTKINSIGNLCLLSQPANSSAGQNPFTSKVRDYSEITALARELKSFDSDWNLAAVEKRSSRLAERARVRWAWSNV